MGLETRIGASRLGFEPQYWDLSLKAGIEAQRLETKAGGGGGTEKKEEEEKEKEEEKISHMCESIGHRPLQGRCPTHYHIISYTKNGQRVPLTI